MTEVTHTVDADTGRYVQIVTPARLRKILDCQGETYDRPDHFGNDDEWNVEGITRQSSR